MLAVIYAVAMGLGMGATAIVARRTGEKNPEGAALAAVQAIGLGLIVAIPIGLTGLLARARSCSGSWARPPA